MDLKELESIANRELSKHGLQGWTFALGAAKRCLGVCKYRTKRIEIAEYYALNSPPETVIDTLMHEIAHAIAGPKAGHGPVWKEIAMRLGASPQACDKTQMAVLKPGDWQATCPACGKTYHRYKRPKTVSGYRCKCAAGLPLMFEFMGDPARKPLVPVTVQRTANWEAKCSGCETVHRRSRRPKAGVWRCKCPHRCEITWQFRPQGSTHE